MEHPLIGDLDSLTVDELREKCTELSKKLNWAYRSNNLHLATQIQMAYESYNTKYQEKLRGNDKDNFKDIIDIQ